MTLSVVRSLYIQGYRTICLVIGSLAVIFNSNYTTSCRKQSHTNYIICYQENNQMIPWANIKMEIQQKQALRFVLKNKK